MELQTTLSQTAGTGRQLRSWWGAKNGPLPGSFFVLLCLLKRASGPMGPGQSRGLPGAFRPPIPTPSFTASPSEVYYEIRFLKWRRSSPFPEPHPQGAMLG